MVKRKKENINDFQSSKKPKSFLLKCTMGIFGYYDNLGFSKIIIFIFTKIRKIKNNY